MPKSVQTSHCWLVFIFYFTHELKSTQQLYIPLDSVKTTFTLFILLQLVLVFVVIFCCILYCKWCLSWVQFWLFGFILYSCFLVMTLMPTLLVLLILSTLFIFFPSSIFHFPPTFYPFFLPNSFSSVSFTSFCSVCYKFPMLHPLIGWFLPAGKVTIGRLRP